MDMNSRKIPYLFLERGYFLDVQYFFGQERLSGFKLLCGICDLNCYYCHRIPLFRKTRDVPIAEILEEMSTWEPYNIATLTGGEITLLPDEAKYLAEELRKRKKKVVISTNAKNKGEIAELVDYVDIVKIDLKASHRKIKEVCGEDYYNDALESIAICASSKPTEVKMLIHSFDTAEDIKSRLADLQRITGYPRNMIVQFQLIHDFLDKGIGVENGSKYRNTCKNLSPLPEIVLFKEYGRQETIEILKAGKWELFGKKEVPLVIEKETRLDGGLNDF